MKVQSVGFYNQFEKKSVQPLENKAAVCNANFELPNYKQIQSLKPVAFKGVDKKRLYNLIDEGILPETANRGLTRRGDFNPDIKRDLKKIEIAKKRGIPIGEMFVPSFYDDKSAQAELKVGDTYRIHGERNIKILGKNRKPIELALSKEKYLELFPPAKRFSTAQSSGIGNCWFLSALDTMYSNPVTRAKVLSVFRKDHMGNVDINFGGYEVNNSNVVQKKTNEPNIQGSEIRKQYQMNCPKGFAMIENAYETRCRYHAQINIKDQFIEFSKHKYDKIPRINGQRYTKDEIYSFIDLATPYLNDLNELSKKIIDPKIKGESFYLSKKDVEKYYKYLNSKEASSRYSRSEIKQLKQILLRHYEYMKRTGVRDVVINDIIPAKLYFDFTLSDKKDIERFSGFPYSCGGYAEDAFRLFGIKSESFSTKDNKNRLNHLLSTDNINSKYVITAGINDGNEVNKFGFMLDDMHEYSVKPMYRNGEITYFVKNPHNASHSIPMNQKELLKYFDEITFAKIEE